MTSPQMVDFAIPQNQRLSCRVGLSELVTYTRTTQQRTSAKKAAGRRAATERREAQAAGAEQARRIAADADAWKQHPTDDEFGRYRGTTQQRRNLGSSVAGADRAARGAGRDTAGAKYGS